MGNGVRPVPVADVIPMVGDSKVQIVDVRTSAEFAGGHIRGAVNVPYEALLESDSSEAKADELMQGVLAQGVETMVVHCMYSSARGPTVALSLAAKAVGEGINVDVVYLEGGFHAFVNTVHGESAAMPPEGAQLVEGFQATRWRRTAKDGLVDVEAVEAFEALGGEVA